VDESSAWKAVQDAAGNTYYVHSGSGGGNSWDPPPGFNRSEVLNTRAIIDAGCGRIFW
jgi:hypothetical protein